MRETNTGATLPRARWPKMLAKTKQTIYNKPIKNTKQIAKIQQTNKAQQKNKHTKKQTNKQTNNQTQQTEPNQTN